MTDKELIQQLQDLSYVHAPKALHKRIAALADDLPSIYKGSVFPLFAFQMAIVGVVLLILVGLGSGAVVAAKSTPGTPLFPVREVLHKIIPHIVEDAFPSPTPIEVTPAVPSPITPTKSPSGEMHHVQVSGDDEEDNEVNFFEKSIKNMQGVKAAHDEQRRNGSSHHQDH